MTEPPRESDVGGGPPRESDVGGGPPRESDVGGGPPPESDVGGGPPPDPWRSLRGVMAGTLILEAIVVLLALPVVNMADNGLSATNGGFLVGMAVVLVLMTGIQARPWAIWANLGIQSVLIAGVVVHGTVAFIGVVFAVVWLLIAYLRAEVKRREARGQLPGQQPPDTAGD